MEGAFEEMNGNLILAKRFIDHHVANPQMWRTYEELALRTAEKGTGSAGPNALIEQLRWSACDVGDPDDGFRINDAYTSFYSRMFAFAHPQHSGLFRYKSSAADYLNYNALLDGDISGALNWVDPQLALPLEL